MEMCSSYIINIMFKNISSILSNLPEINLTQQEEDNLINSFKTIINTLDIADSVSNLLDKDIINNKKAINILIYLKKIDMINLVDISYIFVNTKNKELCEYIADNHINDLDDDYLYNELVQENSSASKELTISELNTWKIDLFRK